jgi:hypothetical protein
MLTLSAAANSGISIPSQPTTSWVSYVNSVSTFTITNLDSRSIYSFVPTTGSVSFNSSNGSISVNTGSEFEVTINIISIKGQLVGPSKIIGRKNITTYYTYGTVCDPQDLPPGQECGSGNCGSGCSCDGPGCCCNFRTVITGGPYENSPPANYQKIGSVWVRL